MAPRRVTSTTSPTPEGRKVSKRRSRVRLVRARYTRRATGHRRPLQVTLIRTPTGARTESIDTSAPPGIRVPRMRTRGNGRSAAGAACRWTAGPAVLNGTTSSTDASVIGVAPDVAGARSPAPSPPAPGSPAGSLPGDGSGPGAGSVPGGGAGAGGAAATTPVGGDSALSVSPLDLTVTSTASREPTSSAIGVYDAAVAPAMFLHFGCATWQRIHVHRAVAAAGVQAAVASSRSPTAGVPVIAGSVVMCGSSPSRALAPGASASSTPAATAAIRPACFAAHRPLTVVSLSKGPLRVGLRAEPVRNRFAREPPEAGPPRGGRGSGRIRSGKNLVMAKNHGSSVKNDKQYEALRDQGASKEKAARIANANSSGGGNQASRRGGKSSRYEDKSKDELLEKARQGGIEGRSKMSKGELANAPRNH